MLDDFLARNADDYTSGMQSRTGYLAALQLTIDQLERLSREPRNAKHVERITEKILKVRAMQAEV